MNYIFTAVWQSFECMLYSLSTEFPPNYQDWYAMISFNILYKEKPGCRKNISLAKFCCTKNDEVHDNDLVGESFMKISNYEDK